jgi:hypothetical protein
VHPKKGVLNKRLKSQSQPIHTSKSTTTTTSPITSPSSGLQRLASLRTASTETSNPLHADFSQLATSTPSLISSLPHSRSIHPPSLKPLSTSLPKLGSQTPDQPINPQSLLPASADFSWSQASSSPTQSPIIQALRSLLHFLPLDEQTSLLHCNQKQKPPTSSKPLKSSGASAPRHEPVAPVDTSLAHVQQN